MSRADTAGARRAFWATAACYSLIAFEFFYMATPFAAYFYAAYRPGQNFFDTYHSLSILNRTFLPHIAVSTNNPVVDAHNIVGAVLAVAGFTGFCVGALQVYVNKLRRRGVVLGGVYRWVRHPQYTCLALSSLGMLLLWPRYVVLFAFVAMLFAYRLLARAEERECLARFGEPYREYLRGTHAFLPFGFPWPRRWTWTTGTRTVRSLRRWVEHRGRPTRIAAVLTAYTLTAGLAAAAAGVVNTVALASLSARYSPDAVYLSVTRMNGERLARITAVSDADPRTRAAVTAAGPDARLINYVLPATWDISETLMRPRPGQERVTGSTYQGNRYRVVYTKATLTRPAHGRDILVNTATRTPLLEVVVDLADTARGGRVVEVLPPDPHPRYRGVPVPVY